MPEIQLQTSLLVDEHKIATITIANEQRLNCLSSALARQLTAVFTELAADSELRVVRLQGAGRRAFIGGADIVEMAALNPHSAKVFINDLHQTCAAIRNLPVPVIAQIAGYCLGVGLEIAASCDLRIADKNASFAMPEVQIGLPSVIEAALLPRLIGWGRASRLIYTGESIDAATACNWGLVEQIVEPDALPVTVENTMTAIVRADANAIRTQKQLLNDWQTLSLDESIRHSIEIFPQSFETDQARQRMRAFLADK